MSKSKESKSDLENGIIVLGCPRSGTTLLRRLLDAHPDIACPGETFLFKACSQFLHADDISGGFDYGVLGALEGLNFPRNEVLDRLRGLATGFYDDIAKAQGKKYWAAKTAVDAFYMDGIEALFADRCKFICITRHGLDVACSMEEFSKDLGSYITELHTYIADYPKPYEAFARAWMDVTEDILDFAEEYEDRCFTLRYEDLVETPDEHMESLMEFLGLPALPQPVADILQNKTVGGVGDWKSFKKSKVETSSIGRWEQLPAHLITHLAPVINPTLERCGYDPIQTETSDDDEKRRQELAMMLMQAGK